MVEEGGRLLWEREEAPNGMVHAPLFKGMMIIQRQKKKKRRCIPKIQEGTCSFVLKRRYQVISPLSFSEGHRPGVGDAGRREDGACFGF
jgi:hypothetical protein